MLWSVALTLSLCYVSSVTGAESSVRVTSPSGTTYVGQTIDTYDGQSRFNAYKGIPYAEPPVGDLRFRPTVAKAKIDGEYDAREYKPFCIQWHLITEFGGGQEDCLYLNVYTPTHVDTDGKDALKVFVFIHGGGNSNGFTDMYNPGSLVVNHDVIVVTMNYRLNVMGFLSTNNDACPGNQGIYDQIEALKWVQENIRAFGGDPDQVTVGGESAGGIDTSLLTVASSGRNLFARAFPMSGTAGKGLSLAEDQYGVASLFARREKCLGESDPEPVSAEEWTPVMECLRAVPEERFAFAAIQELGMGVPMPAPVVDGDLIPKMLDELFTDPAYLESIAFHEKDYLVSLCYNEGDLFNVMAEIMETMMTPEQLEAMAPNGQLHSMIQFMLSPIFGPVSQEVVNLVAQYYEENHEVNALADFAADAVFHVPSLVYVSGISKDKTIENSRVRLLRFVNWPEYLRGRYQGTQHGLDLAYLFDLNVTDMNKIVDYKIDGSFWNQSDDDLKLKYIALVASFIKTGKPSTTQGQGENETPVEWPAFEPEGGNYLVFNEAPHVEQHLKQERVELFLKQIPEWIQEFPFQPPEQEQQKHASDEL